MLKGTKILCRQAKTVITSDCLVRSKHSNEGFELQGFGQGSSKSHFHQSQVKEYPATKQLPLPTNIEDLPSSEKLKFSPQRNREINGSFISHVQDANVNDSNNFSVNETTECYDCFGAVSLSSAMQTNVPYPFVSKGKPTHLNMPGGQWAQNEKYTSEELNNVHLENLRGSNAHTGGTIALGYKTGNKTSYMYFQSRDPIQGSLWPSVNINQFRYYCTGKDKVQGDENSSKQETGLFSQLRYYFTHRREQLKAAVKEYGVVVIVFHVGISLISLGVCYLIIASGIDLTIIPREKEAGEGPYSARLAGEFVLAYALHKAMAPARILVTLTSVPFIVRKLRKMGLMKGGQLKTQ